MPAEYSVGDKASYAADLQSTLGIFGSDCKMPADGPARVEKIESTYVPKYKGKSANTSETFTNEFADKAASA